MNESELERFIEHAALRLSKLPAIVLALEGNRVREYPDDPELVARQAAWNKAQPDRAVQGPPKLRGYPLQWLAERLNEKLRRMHEGRENPPRVELAAMKRTVAERRKLALAFKEIPLHEREAIVRDFLRRFPFLVETVAKDLRIRPLPPAENEPAADPPTADPAKTTRRAPTKEELVAWRLYRLGGRTQADVAEELSRQFKRPFTQGQVSKMIKRVEQFDPVAREVGQKPAQRAQVRSIPPDRLELGRRTDGRRALPQDRRIADESDE
jgi:hypothetical protein